MKFALLVCAALGATATVFADGETQPARDPKQPIDEAYTAKIHKYTTESYFSSPLVDYLPASKSVPTPEVVLGDVAGAPGILPYAEEVYKYMRLLEKATPRVKVFSIGTTEEGREMIAVAISSEANLKNLEQNHQRLAKLADPRSIQLNDAEADKLVSECVPIYYITGTIHSTETGAPTALMRSLPIASPSMTARISAKSAKASSPSLLPSSKLTAATASSILSLASCAPKGFLSAADLLGQIRWP